MSGPELRVVLVLKRYHTNLAGALDAVKANGGQILVVVDCPTKAEANSEHSFIHSGGGATSKRLVERTITDFRPSILVQRDFTSGKMRFWHLARSKGIPAVVYDQGPVHISTRTLAFDPRRTVGFLIRLLAKRILLGKHLRLSPVASWGPHLGPRIPGSIRMPLPMPARIQKPRSGSSPPLVACVAKVGQSRKRTHWLLRYLARHPHAFQLILLGSKFKINLYSLFVSRWTASLRKRREKISVHLDLPQKKVHQFLRQADLFVLPSRRELFAYSPLEALAQGTPVLVSSKGGAADYVRSFDERFLFSEGSFRSFEHKLTALLSNLNASQVLRKTVHNKAAPIAFQKQFLTSLNVALRIEVDRIARARLGR